MKNIEIPELCQNCEDNESCQWVVECYKDVEKIPDGMPYSRSSDWGSKSITVRRGYKFNPINVLDSENISLLINKNTGNCAKKDKLEGCYLRVLYFEPFVKAEKATANQILKQLEMTKITSNNLGDAEKQIEAVKNKKADITRYIEGLKLKTL